MELFQKDMSDGIVGPIFINRSNNMKRAFKTFTTGYKTIFNPDRLIRGCFAPTGPDNPIIISILPSPANLSDKNLKKFALFVE